VVVIGAGVAGLTAAHALARAGYRPLVLERSGHLGGKLMSAEGYGGFPIEHGVHGWWKGYGNFFDVLRLVHGPGWDRDLFRGPFSTRFTLRLPGGKVLSMRRPAPREGESRLSPFLGAIGEMIRQGGLSRSDALSLAPILARTIAFDHATEYAARWLRTHPAPLVHQPLAADIEAHGGTVALYTRTLALDTSGGRVDTVIVDRHHSGHLAAEDFCAEPRDLLDERSGPEWRTPPVELDLARSLLRDLGHGWLALDPGTLPPRPLAWSGDASRPASPEDARWLAAEWSDAGRTRVRLIARDYETLGTLDARDVPDGGFRELFAGRDLATDPRDLAGLREALARESWRIAARVQDLTQPASVLLFVGRIDGALRAYSGICTHLGGRLRYDPGVQAFACDIHGSRFGCDGQAQCGPAEAGLLPFRLVASSRPERLELQVPRFGRIRADHVVVATDVTGLRQIIQASPALHRDPAATRLLRLRTTSVTVVRLVLGRRVEDALGLFSGFDMLDSLFNVTKLQGLQLEQCRGREHEVIELQLYRDGLAGQLSRAELLERIRAELRQAYGWDEEPEVLEPVHVATFRGAYASFDPESEQARA
jgi:nitrite reductase/ring-hydroxylating ferredoxin subunit